MGEQFHIRQHSAQFDHRARHVEAGGDHGQGPDSVLADPGPRFQRVAPRRHGRPPQRDLMRERRGIDPGAGGQHPQVRGAADTRDQQA